MDPASKAKAYALIVVIGLVGIVGILTILGLWWARMRHQSRMRQLEARRRAEAADPWKESARRARPEDAPLPPDGSWPADRDDLPEDFDDTAESDESGDDKR